MSSYKSNFFFELLESLGFGFFYFLALPLVVFFLIKYFSGKKEAVSPKLRKVIGAISSLILIFIGYIVWAYFLSMGLYGTFFLLNPWGMWGWQRYLYGVLYITGVVLTTLTINKFFVKVWRLDDKSISVLIYTFLVLVAISMLIAFSPMWLPERLLYNDRPNVEVGTNVTL